ncbi:acetylglutamate kinase [Limnochorda pilosa]|uniref:Acetylglutamate kinase n=2 Tax=Limnochorda pilosa TaxID=1555112 RepID=A0A0K2SI61_LIMPI|nr:acetylglutamate kinase [Limnochorda pilosa]
MRMLWEQHAAWTMMTIISITESLADEDLVTRRLLRNPADIAAVFRPLYGDKVAGRLNDLLTEHLVLAAQLVQESKAGESAAAEETERRWYANADEIASFLGEINLYWSREGMRRMWREHLDLVKAQAVARLNRDYASGIAHYDEGEQLLLRMADEFTAGILRQFPGFVPAM